MHLLLQGWTVLIPYHQEALKVCKDSPTDYSICMPLRKSMKNKYIQNTLFGGFFQDPDETKTIFLINISFILQNTALYKSPNWRWSGYTCLSLDSEDIVQSTPNQSESIL